MKDLVQKRLEEYNAQSKEEELNALKEITQEVALYSLHKAGFFNEACFIGGTGLRILHGLDRFSEDLDFSLIRPTPNFSLDTYLKRSMQEMNAYGYDLSIDEKDLSDKNIQSRFLKDDSIKNVLTFKHAQDLKSKIKIKIEIDTSPPEAATLKAEYVDFPMDFQVQSYDLPSLMSGKLHALLCRPFIKGRDWYDFSWYVTKGVTPNYAQLANALFQLGPWKGQEITVDDFFLREKLREKIETLKWQDVARDVRKFLRPAKAETLDLWSEGFFKAKLEKAKL
jgi:predicted nucleotidyltransferase component of viral defense system